VNIEYSTSKNNLCVRKTGSFATGLRQYHKVQDGYRSFGFSLPFFLAPPDWQSIRPACVFFTRFQVVTVLLLQIEVVWDIMSRRLLVLYR